MGEQNGHSELRQPDADRRADDREHHALRHQLANESPAARTERAADRHLGLSCRRTHEQQVGDVGAGDQQHEHHGGENDVEGLFQIADRILLNVQDLGAPLAIHLGEPMLHRLRDQPHLAVRGVDGNIVLHAPENAHPTRSARIVAQLLRGEHAWRPDLGGERIALFRGNDADDRERPRIDPHGLADHPLVAAEVAPPELLAQHHDRCRARLVFPLAEETPVEGLDAQEVEQIRSHLHALNPLGVAALEHDVRGPAVDDRKADEILGLRRIVDDVHRRGRVAVSLLRESNANQPVRLREWRRLKQDVVDDGEDRRVRADAEGQRDDRGGGEGGGGAQLSRGVDDVLPEVAHVLAPPLGGFGVAVHGADVAPCVVDVAELAHRLRAGGVGRKAERDEGVDPHVEMERELGLEVGADLSRRAPGKTEKPAARTHVGSRTLNTAAAYCRHTASSARRCRRPAVVNS